MSLIHAEAFAHYSAKLNNQNGSVSAFGSDGCLVVSLWQDWLKRAQEIGTLVYTDTLSHWKGNKEGQNELRRHLVAVRNSGAPIKLVVTRPASSADPALVGKVSDEGKNRRPSPAAELPR
jgi:hypothetical protein